MLNSISDRDPRYDCNISATLTYAGVALPIKILNASSSGLGICKYSHVVLLSGQRLSIECEELGTLAGVIIWASYPKYGVRLEDESRKSKKLVGYLNVQSILRRNSEKGALSI